MSMKRAFDLSTKDKGHRFGNFHNYYTFNPTKNRLVVIASCGILDSISLSMAKRKESACNNSSDGEEKEVKRQKVDSNFEESKDIVEVQHRKQDFYYCDIGCNEGDLTLEIAKEIFERMQRHFRSQKVHLKCLGLDIDPELIRRATKKSQDIQLNQVSGTNPILSSEESIKEQRDVIFKECNICDKHEYLSICSSFLGNDTSTIINDKNSDDPKKRTIPNADKETKFDLISIFSTTMWIHIHSGDDGLKEFLKRTCEMTNAILIEPQPSKCYRSVNVRLRKNNCEEVEDISCTRLRMRSDIENEIEKVFCSCGFRRLPIENSNLDDVERETGKINPELPSGTTKKNESSHDDKERDTAKKDRTSWKRILQLYVRIK